MNAEDSQAEPLRVFYAAGCGDVLNTYEHWKKGVDDPTQLSVTYSGQFYSLRQQMGFQAYVYSDHPRAGRVVDGPITVAHHPRPRGGAGFRYHAASVRSGLQILTEARAFRADVVLINAGMTHWFVLRLFRRYGIRVIPALHCSLWADVPEGSMRRRVVHSALWRFGVGLFRDEAFGVLGFPGRVTEQLEELTGGRHSPLEQFVPSYRPGRFDGLPAPSRGVGPFRVLFAGRLEPEKGAFDLLTVASAMRDRGATDFAFEVCGDGSALEGLRARAESMGLGATFRFHGQCDREQMLSALGRSHVLIVPTRALFAEGFNKVVVEGVLAGRPVVSSAASRSSQFLAPAVVEVPTGDTDAYTRALLRLKDDPAFYRESADACAAVVAPYYDPQRSWAAALRRMLERLSRERIV